MSKIVVSSINNTTLSRGAYDAAAYVFFAFWTSYRSVARGIVAKCSLLLCSLLLIS